MNNNDMYCAVTAIHEDIVKNVKKVMPNESEFFELENLFKMFSDSTRIKILWALDNSELCVCDLAALLGMTKSAISHQLKSLRIANLVKYRKVGRVVYYSLSDDHVKDILERGFDHINE